MGEQAIRPASLAALNRPGAAGDGLAGRLRFVARLLARDLAGLLGLVLFLLIVAVAVLGPQIVVHDPLGQNLSVSKMPPAWAAKGDWSYPLGTDNLGRDLFSRIIYGSRVSLTVGFFGVFIAGSLGLVIGLIAGYAGGRVDAVIMTVVNIVLAFPYLLLVVIIAGVLGRSLLNVILILGVTDAPIFVRIARGEVLRIRQSGYVESAICVGARPARIIFDHILPNLIGPLMTVATFEMSAMIFYEAGLGFLGLSVPPSVPSWGNMLEAGRKYLQTAPWIAAFPGVAIMLTSLSMNLFGDWLRDVLDPRLRRAKR